MNPFTLSPPFTLSLSKGVLPPFTLSLSKGVLILLLLSSCATAPESKPAAGSSSGVASDAPAAPRRPVKLVVVDRRSDLEQSESLLAIARGAAMSQLAAAEVPVADDAPVVLHVELRALGGRRVDSASSTCVLFGGRVIREGREFLAVDVPSERCIKESAYASTGEPIPLILAASAPGSKVSDPEKLAPRRAYLDALEGLVSVLIRQSR